MNRLTGPNFRRYVPIIKAAIALAVAVGLVLAVRSAVGQWNQQTQKVQQRLGQLDAQLETAQSSQIVELQNERDAVQASVPTLANIRWRFVLVAALLYACALVPPGLVLCCALTTMGESPRGVTCVAAQLLGHVGKYVPGKAMVIILRAASLSRDGVHMGSATVAVFMETFLMMAVGAAISGAIIFRLPVPAWMTWLAAFVAIAATIPTLPPVLRHVVARLARSDEPIGSRQSRRFFFVGWAWSVLAWLLVGSSFGCLILAIPSIDDLPSGLSLFAIATAAIGLAMVVGFASLLPGGAGIRELVLTTLLATSIGTAHAMLSAVAARLLFIAVESVMASLAWLWLRQDRLARAAPTKDGVLSGNLGSDDRASIHPVSQEMPGEK
tara:strand:- start:23191 stop:24339 length:1149 start_codon:yes stop_codon:yes gene_type:complete